MLSEVAASCLSNDKASALSNVCLGRPIGMFLKDGRHHNRGVRLILTDCRRLQTSPFELDGHKSSQFMKSPARFDHAQSTS